MQIRQYLMIFAALMAVSFLWRIQPVAADTYEFEVVREVARLPSGAVDLNSLKAAAASGQFQNIQGAKPALKKEAELLSARVAPVFQPPQKSRMIVKTGPAALCVLSKDKSRIFDFKNMRIYELNPASKTYLDHSLFADLAFRKAKLQNRLAIHKIIGKALAGRRRADPAAEQGNLEGFFVEEKFALSMPDKASGCVFQKTKEGAADVYRVHSVVVCSFTPQTQTVPPEKLSQFSRFLIYCTQLHPHVREDIEKSGRLPQKLVTFLDSRPVSKERTTYILKNAAIGDYVAAVPAGYTRAMDPRNPLIPVYARIKELGGSPPADLKESVLKYYKRAVDNKNYIDALLALSEYGLQTGETLSSEMAAIKDEIKEDPDCRRLVSGLQTPENERQALAFLEGLDAIDRSKSSKSYLIDLFRANLMVTMNDRGYGNPTGKPEDDPAAMFVKVLLHNPFNAGVYHDLGNFLESTEMQPVAWECYDLAQKFYPRHPILKDIAEREQELLDSFPQFFLGDKIQSN